MKKSKIRLVTNAFLSASLRGLAVFAVFGMALYTYAAISYPTQPAPVSGVVGLYVGVTNSTFTGNIPVSAPYTTAYEVANANCAADHDEAHVCTAMEIINTYNHAPGNLSGASGPAWINNGPPAYTQAAPNDCNGWSTTVNSFFATSWNFDLGFGTAGSCNLNQPFACCK